MSTMSWHALSPEQQQYLQSINAHLTRIEHQFKAAALAMSAELNARVEAPEDWLCDYEIELGVSFWLRQDDPAYREDDDNIMVTLHERLTHRREDDTFSIGDGRNYNGVPPDSGLAPTLGTEPHCWLYHRLYDDSDLTWNDLLRIGHIWVDMQVIYQYEVAVDGGPSRMDRG
jgi:hypothetical protein